MAQNTISRLSYERLGVLLTDFPAYKENSAVNSLIRVQGIDYQFSNVVQDIKVVGSDRLMTKSGESPVIRQPDIGCSVNCLFSQAENESLIGLYTGQDYSVLKNFFDAPSTDDTNIIVVASNESQVTDLNHIDDENQFSGYNVVGIGNAFLSSYSYNAQVGALPETSFAYEASNMKFDTYNPNDLPTMPAIKLGVDNQFSNEQIALDENSFNESLSELQSSAIAPGNIEIDITKNFGSHGGSPIESIHAAIQSISIDLPIERQSIYGFGSNYVFDRKLKLPIIGNVSINMILREYSEGQVEEFFDRAATYDLTISHLDKVYTGGSFTTKDNTTVFSIQDAQLRSQNFSVGIGDSLIVTSSLIFEVTKDKGLKLYQA